MGEKYFGLAIDETGGLGIIELENCYNFEEASEYADQHSFNVIWILKEDDIEYLFNQIREKVGIGNG